MTYILYRAAMWYILCGLITTVIATYITGREHGGIFKLIEDGLKNDPNYKQLPNESMWPMIIVCTTMTVIDMILRWPVPWFHFFRKLISGLLRKKDKDE